MNFHRFLIFEVSQSKMLQEHNFIVLIQKCHNNRNYRDFTELHKNVSNKLILLHFQDLYNCNVICPTSFVTVIL